MNGIRNRKNVLSLLLVAVFLLLMPLSLYCYGDDSSKQVSSLLSPQQLKGWIDNGYRDERGLKVVILDTSFGPAARTDYNAGHVPGAYYVDYATELKETRSDGPIMVDLMVPDGPQMDSSIQKYGIDKDTVVVFTGHHIMWATRAYWTYRYWGFPQDHLFVLNGKATTDKSVWKAAGYALETNEPPLPKPAAFSVGNWPGNMDMVRASLQEFMGVASGNVPNTVILDTRSDTEWNAELVGIMYNVACAYHIKNSVWKEWVEELVGANYTEKATGSHTLKPIAQILSEYKALGLTEDKTVYSLCSSGVRATVPFFIYDGILGWKGKMKVYDGSTREIGQLVNVQNKNGTYNLPKNSPWRWDLPKYNATITCQPDPAKVTVPQGVNPDAITGKEINDTDKGYYKKAKALK
jgi:3-mercaptopyruvate sulfurtransferase SseA